MTDKEQIPMLLDSLIDIYRVLKQYANEYAVLEKKGSNDEEMLAARKNLMAAREVYQKACNVFGFTLSELKNSGYIFEGKMVKAI
ncbi:MAG: hypothetical protein ABI597_10465 [Gammaproteobacteria bacterium]